MATLLLVLSMFFATVPMLIFLTIVWWLDRYDREPVWLVGFVFLWGALFSTVGSLFFNSFGTLALTAVAGPENASTLSVMLLAPLVEEPMKASVLVLVAVTRWFDNATDGFVYGAAVGLGFAVTENFLYFAHNTHDVLEWVFVVVIRTGCSGLMHAIASSIVGAALGWAKCRTRDIQAVAFILGLSTAMIIHFLWNTLVVVAGLGNGEAFVLDIVIFAAEFIVVFGVFMACLQGEHRMILRELRIEAEGGVLPPQHVAILASVTKRNRVGWCPEDVDQGQYIEIATRLAFRRMQCRGRGGGHSEFHKEARALRHRLRALLGTSPLPPQPGDVEPC